MELEQLWEKYQAYKKFNYDSLPEEMKQAAVKVSFAPKAIITLAGEYPEYVYFLASGIVQGTRIYRDGNSYHYFVLRKEDGSIGLLELLAQEQSYVATIIAQTPVTAYRVEASAVYALIMSDLRLMRSCLYVVAHDLYQRSGNDGLLYHRNGCDRMRFFLANYYRTHAKEGETVSLDADYQAIANSIGVSLRTVGRSVQQMKSMGLVSSVKKKILISPEQYEALQEGL